jgi:hypothetical protein
LQPARNCLKENLQPAKGARALHDDLSNPVWLQDDAPFFDVKAPLSREPAHVRWTESFSDGHHPPIPVISRKLAVLCPPHRDGRDEPGRDEAGKSISVDKPDRTL